MPQTDRKIERIHGVYLFVCTASVRRKKSRNGSVHLCFFRKVKFFANKVYKKDFEKAVKSAKRTEKWLKKC